MYLLYRNAWAILALLIFVTGYCLTGVSSLTVDPSFDRILVQGGADQAAYRDAVDTFGSDKSAIIFVNDPKLFTLEKLTMLQNLVWDYQELPYVTKVQSPFTTSFIRSHRKTLHTTPIFNEVDESWDQSSLTWSLKKIQEDPFLHQRIIDSGANSLSIIVSIDNQIVKLKDVAKKINQDLKRLKPHFATIYQTGEPTIEYFAQNEMVSSQKKYIPLILLVLLLSFYFLIKSINAFFVTVVVTSLAVIWTIPIMNALSIPIQIMISIVPGIVLTLSATEVIHIFSSANHAHEKNITKPIEVLDFIVKDIGLPLTLTFTTTAIGFLTIAYNDIIMLREFAYIAASSLIFAFIATCLYLPVHLRLFPITYKKSKATFNLFHYFTNMAIKVYDNLRTKSWGILSICLFILLNLFFASKMKVDNDAYAMLSDKTKEKNDLNHYKKQFGGTRRFFLIVENKNSHFKEKNELNKLWLAHRKLKELEETTHVESYSGLISLLNKEMTTGRKTDFNIPQSQNLIEQYTLTLSQNDLSPYITSDFKRANITVAHDTSSTYQSELMIKNMKQVLTGIFPQSDYRITITSKNYLNLKASHTIIKNQAYSLVTVSLIIIIMLSLFFRSAKVGLASILPNLFPITCLFGMMGFASVPLNIGTCIVAAITIGIAADDTIHLFSRFIKLNSKSSSARDASLTTIKEEMTPILTTSLSLSLSFCVFYSANFIPLEQFGLLSAYVLIVAVFSDLCLGPTILTKLFSK